MTRPSSASAQLRCSLTTPSSTRSPGAVRGMNTARPSGSRETPAPPAAIDATRRVAVTSALPSIPQTGPAPGFDPPPCRAAGRDGRLAVPPRLVLGERRRNGDHALHVPVLGGREQVLPPVEELD